MTLSALFSKMTTPLSLNPCNHACPDQSATVMDRMYLGWDVRCMDTTEDMQLLVFRLRMGLITLFTPPTVIDLCHFHIITLRSACRMCNILALYMHHCSLGWEKVWFVRHAKLGLLDIEKGLHLSAIKSGERRSRWLHWNVIGIFSLP